MDWANTGISYLLTNSSSIAEYVRWFELATNPLTRVQFNYAAQLLTIFTLICAKLAVSRLILTIRPKRQVRMATYATEGVIVLWALTSIFALAFQCDVPNPWLQGPGRCVNLVRTMCTHALSKKKRG